MNDFHPYSKSDQLRGHKKKEKDPPPFKTKKPKKKNRNPLKQEVYKGRTIPTKQQRGKITTKEYNEALKQHGESCWICGTTQGLEAHHVRLRSNGGRGVYRNIRFLCSEHHRGDISPHQDKSIREQLERLHESLYGPYYYADRFDLFKLGLIPNTTIEAYEEFMRGEEERVKNIR